LYKTLLFSVSEIKSILQELALQVGLFKYILSNSSPSGEFGLEPQNIHFPIQSILCDFCLSISNQGIKVFIKICFVEVFSLQDKQYSSF